MATTIKLKNGSGAPLAGDLVAGEPALDLTNKRLYTEDSGGTVIEVGTNPSTLTVDTDTLVVDSTNNRVGIGDASPPEKLVVTGTDGDAVELYLNQNAADTTFDLKWTDNRTGTHAESMKIQSERQGTAGSYDMLFYTTNSGTPAERMRIDSIGRVGIGTTDPAIKFHVKASATNGGNIAYFDESGTESTGRLQIMSTGGTGSDFMRIAGVNRSLQLGTAAAGHVTIKTDGNVGINDTSPSAPLSVNKGSLGTVANFYGSDDGKTRALSIKTYTPHTLNGSGYNFEVASSQGEFAFGNNTVEIMRLSYSGNVGIGTSSPSARSVSYKAFEVSNTGTANAGGSLRLSNSTNYSDIVNYQDDMYFHNDGEFIFMDHASNESMRIASNGNVGIGETNPGAVLDIKKASNSTGKTLILNATGTQADADRFITFKIDSTAYGYITMPAGSGGAMAFATGVSLSEAMRIDSSGNLLVGRTSGNPNSSSFGINFSGGGRILAASNFGATDTAHQFYGNAGSAKIAGDGDLENTNNSYGGLSDARLKSNIVDASSQLDDIMAVQVRSYTLNETGDTHIGVVAQELEASGMSGLVKTKDDGMKSVKYSILYIKAIKALQEAVTRIQTLEAEVAALKGE